MNEVVRAGRRAVAGRARCMALAVMLATIAMLLALGASPLRAADVVPVRTDASNGPSDLAGDEGSDPSLVGAPPVTVATPHAAEVQEATAMVRPARAAALEDIKILLRPIATGLAGPLFVGHAGDGSGRLYIVEKPGTIRILQDGELLPQPFLDIRDRVGSGGNEQGLLGLAFAPDFAESRHFFVNYTDKDGNTHIARFTASAPNSADASTEFTVLTIAQPATNHNGGMLAFGPDGYLYIGTGDGGGDYKPDRLAQDPQSLLGKMLRIDVTTDTAVPYLIPPDNPWVTSDLNGKDVRNEIWALGLRNPWRFSFDRQTGDLWIADVGQNTYEEVNWTPAGSTGGLNFGWPIQEGSHCLDSGCDSTGLVQPVLEYQHGEGPCASITGGYVYRGAAYPQLRGLYFYGDYCTGVIWLAEDAGAGAWRSARIHDAEAWLSSFGEDEDGELYVTALRGGIVYRVSMFSLRLPLVRR